jgi:glucokinase
VTAAPKPCLLGDIGGTNARFALLAEDGALHDPRVLDCAAHAGLEDAAQAYLADCTQNSAPVRAAFCVASPVTGDAIEMTNRDWSFSIEGLRAGLGLEVLHVVNDFTAVALALPRLGPGDMTIIGGGSAVAGAPKALLGPGTGLGVSGLIPNREGGGWTPLATEGGHVTLPSTDQRQALVIEALRARFGHVSAERALSGPGLVNLYETLAAMEDTPAETLEPAEVMSRALAGTDRCATDALAMFSSMLGTVAGDLALSLGALGSIYIAGGIVPRMTEFLGKSDFRARFEDKGRFKDYMARIPTLVITRDQPAFLGLSSLLDE